MSTVDPRTPVIVGAGQFLQRPQEPTGALEPVEMMAEAVRRAAHDTGAAGLAEQADAIRVVKGAWPYHDPGRIVAERLGASPRQTALSTDGGNTRSRSSTDHASTSRPAASTWSCWSAARASGHVGGARRAAKTIPYTDDSASPAAEVLGHELKMSSRLEMERGFEAPINIYPTFENAIRAQRGESIPEHRTRISELWERFNQVAVDNPYAWVRRPMTWSRSVRRVRTTAWSASPTPRP